MVALWKKAALALALYYIATFVYTSVVWLGYHVTVYNTAPGPCRKIAEIPHGSEDFSLLPDGKVIISSGLKFLGANELPTYQGRQGRIFLFDMNKPDIAAKEFTADGTFDLAKLNPLGTTVWQSNGILYLYIVNLNQLDSWVEKFRVDTERLILHHEKSIKHDDFRYLNSLHAVGEDQFYYTNYCNIWNRSPFLTQVEMNLRFRWGNVGFYNKGHTQIVADNFLFPNGITVSRDGKFLYVSHIGERRVEVYARHANNSVTKIQEVPLYVLMDNLKIDPATGDLWTGAHPVGHVALDYLSNPAIKSPSMVLRLKTEMGLIKDITLVYCNDGSELSASTVALPYKGHMLAGSVASNPVVCELKTLQ